MATATTFAPTLADTTPNWLLSVKAVSDQLKAFGWVQTADTGQINWTTVTKPTAATAVAGVEVFHPADALQSVAPYLLLVSYGVNGTATRPAVWFRVGQATDGASNAIGTTWGATFMVTAVAGSATINRMRFSGDTGSFRCMLWEDGANSNYYAQGVFSLCRTKNSVGDPDVTGVCMQGTLDNSNTGSLIVPFTGVPPAANTTWLALIPGSPNASALWGTTIGVSPVYPTLGYVRNPLVELVVHFRGDVSAGSVFSLTLYGISRNYLSHSSPSTAGLPSVNGVSMIPAILWQ